MFDDLYIKKSEAKIDEVIESGRLSAVSRRAVRASMVSAARFREALLTDPDFLRAYVDNIAMRFHDRQHWNKHSNKEERLDFRQKDTRDSLALEILTLIFDL